MNGSAAYGKIAKLMETDSENAIGLLTDWLRANPDDPRALYDRAVAYLRTERYTDALADVERLEETAPKIAAELRLSMALDAMPYADIAQSRFRGGDFKGALKYCELALNSDPRHGDAWAIKGMAFVKLGELDKALDSYSRGTAVDPGNPWSFLNRAELHYQRRRLRDALADFSRAIHLRPLDPELYGRRAAVFSDLGMVDEEQRDRRKVETLEAHHTKEKTRYSVLLREIGCRPPAQSESPSRLAEDLSKLEKAIGVPLPPSYRDFLGQGCGGWFGDLLCACREPTPFGQDHWLRGFYAVQEVRTFLDSTIIPRNMVTVAYGDLEKYTCLSVAGVDCGAVYAVDAEFRAHWSDEEFHERFNAMTESIAQYLELRRERMLPEKPIGYGSVYLIAEDFDQFLQCCRRNCPSE